MMILIILFNSKALGGKSCERFLTGKETDGC